MVVFFQTKFLVFRKELFVLLCAPADLPTNFTITTIDNIPILSDTFKATKGNSGKSMQLRQLNAT